MNTNNNSVSAVGVDVRAVEIAPAEIWVAELSVSSNGMHEIRKGAVNHRYREFIGYGATYELAKAIADAHNDKIVADWRAQEARRHG